MGAEKIYEEGSFPTDLEGRMGAVTNAVNSELKILTLLGMGDVFVNGRGIRRGIREIAGRGVYLPDPRAFSDYCLSSLHPMGFAEKEEISTEGKVSISGYFLTEAGRDYGLPISAFSLVWGVDNEISMHSILGSTNSPGKSGTRDKSRAPLNRINILRALREGKLREADLAEKAGLHQADIRSHLESLQKIGFVRYESAGELAKMKGQFKYLFGGTDKEPEPVSGYTDATLKVFDFVKEKNAADYLEAADALEIPTSVTCAILSGLEKQGLLRSEKWKGRFKLSEAELLNPGRKFLDTWVCEVEEFFNGGDNLWNFVDRLGDPQVRKEYFVQGIKNYTVVSRHINAKPREETFEIILNYVLKHPGARPIEIAEATGLSKKGMFNYLTPLVKLGKLRKEKGDRDKGSNMKYYIQE